jgi:hypothetical protein
MPETYQPTYYFRTCCTKTVETDNYFAISDFTISPIPSVGDVFLVELPSFTGCSSIVSSIPTGSSIYAGENASVTSYADCESCLVVYDCYRTPPEPTVTYINVNECGVTTIFPMEVECVIVNPTTPISNDGVASISITGGTPPYTVTWGNGNISSTIMNLGPGSYPAVVSDYWDDYVINTTCVLSAQSYNYLLKLGCVLDCGYLMWTLPNGGKTNLTESIIGTDCLAPLQTNTLPVITGELFACYCTDLTQNCITDYFSYPEIQSCGRKTIKYNDGYGNYVWFVQNIDYSLSVYTIEPGITSGSYDIINYSGCCSQSFMTGLTNNNVYSGSCGSFTGTGLFDWYNRIVNELDMDENYLFYPYYNSGTTKCMVSGGSVNEVVTIPSTYDVLGKGITADNGLIYCVDSLTILEPTVTWNPNSTILQFCDYSYCRS